MRAQGGVSGGEPGGRPSSQEGDLGCPARGYLWLQVRAGQGLGSCDTVGREVSSSKGPTAPFTEDALPRSLLCLPGPRRADSRQAWTDCGRWDAKAHGICPLGAGRQHPLSPQHYSPQGSGSPAGPTSLSCPNLLPPLPPGSASQKGRSAHRGCRAAGLRSGVLPRPPLGTSGRPSSWRCAPSPAAPPHPGAPGRSTLISGSPRLCQEPLRAGGGASSAGPWSAPLGLPSGVGMRLWGLLSGPGEGVPAAW